MPGAQANLIVQALEREVHDLENRLQLCRQESRDLDLQKSQVSDKLAAAEMVKSTTAPHLAYSTQPGTGRGVTADPKMVFFFFLLLTFF
jgi:hypothetical protein